jgi:hypothetical protein
MRKLLVAGVAALTFLAPTPAEAVIFLGARVGYALPAGDVAKNAPLEDDVSANIPIQVDAGVSVLDLLELGVYASYGPTRIAQKLRSSGACAGNACSGQNYRGGLQLNVRVPVVLDGLWGGVFAGLEGQRLKLAAGDVTYDGWEAGLQAGWDFSVLPLLRLGPWVSYSLAEFTKSRGGGASITSDVQAQHNALTFGLRGLFDF